MKYFLVSAVIMLLGCSMPGVGELEKRVDDIEATASYDDSGLVDQIDNLKDDVTLIDERVTALEYGDISGAVDEHGSRIHPAPEGEIQKELAISDITGLQDSMDVLRAGLSDSILALDESFDSLLITMDSLTVANDSLKIELADLQDKVESLSYTVENMRYTGTTSTSSRSSGSSGSGGRGGSGTGSGGSGRGGSSSGGGSSSSGR